MLCRTASLLRRRKYAERTYGNELRLKARSHPWSKTSSRNASGLLRLLMGTPRGSLPTLPDFLAMVAKQCRRWLVGLPAMVLFCGCTARARGVRMGAAVSLQAYLVTSATREARRRSGSRMGARASSGAQARAGAPKIRRVWRGARTLSFRGASRAPLSGCRSRSVERLVACLTIRRERRAPQSALHALGGQDDERGARTSAQRPQRAQGRFLGR